MTLTTEEKEQLEEAKKGWRFTKDFSIGNIFTLVGFVIMLFAWGSTVEKRVVQLEEKFLSHEKATDLADRQYDKDRTELLRKLERMEEKIDFLLNGQKTIKKMM